MANSIKVRFGGMGNINKTFQSLSLKGVSVAKGEVGFNTPYAARVHEDLTMFHQVGEAKFLEKAYKENMQAARDLIKSRLLIKKSLLDSVRRGAELILLKAKEKVPVDTGALRNSGYVKVT